MTASSLTIQNHLQENTMTFSINDIKNYHQLIAWYKRYAGGEQHDLAGMKYWDDQINNCKNLTNVERDFEVSAKAVIAQYLADPSSITDPDARVQLDSKLMVGSFETDADQSYAWSQLSDSLNQGTTLATNPSNFNNATDYQAAFRASLGSSD